MIHPAATGVPWRDMLRRFGRWQTIYERFRLWRDDGTWLRVLRAHRAPRMSLG